MFPLYYGWFLNSTDTKLLVEAARGMIERCLDINEFSADIFEKTGSKNMEELVSQYSWNKLVHSTSRYDDQNMYHNFSESLIRFPRGENKGKEHPEEASMMGKASSLTIAGFIITPRTVGARVMLTREQLTVYHQDDLEPFTVLPPAKVNTRGPPSPSDHDGDDIRSCDPTLRPLEDDSDKAGDMAGEVRGRRAHITLATASGVRPVQTGLDQLASLLAVSRGHEVTGHQLGGGTLRGAGPGSWVITLDTPLTVNTLYTGGY